MIEAAIRDGVNMVNGYVAAKYAVPLASVPDLVRTDFEDAIKALKDVAAGRLVLPVAAGDEAPATVAGKIMAEHPPQVFTPSKLRGWNA